MGKSYWCPYKWFLIFGYSPEIRNTCLLIKESYVQPHIDYCNAIWGGTSQRNLDRLYRLQKRACKIILDYWYENIATSMEELKILNIHEWIFLKKAKFMFKISQSLTPEVP